MRRKVYLIINDGQHVLVGTGGHKGRDHERAQRRGLHLPGGRINRRETPVQAAVREAREETGIPVDPGTARNEFTRREMAGDNPVMVTFFTVRVESVARLVADFVRPRNYDPSDEPFEELHALPVHECWTNEGFNAEYQTEWFGNGLQTAYDDGLFQ